MGFMGYSTVLLDAKGRLALPTRHRDALCQDGQPLVLTVDLREQCLLMYSAAVWAPLAQKLNSLPNIDERFRRMQRLVIGHAMEVEVDGSGRILLPAELREYARLDKRVALVGQVNKFELWNQDNWLERRSEWLRLANEDIKTVTSEDRELFSGF